MSRHLKRNNLWHLRKEVLRKFSRLLATSRKKERDSLEKKIAESEFCTPWCPNAVFPEETELCRYSGMLKCKKYDRLVGKYAVCLNMRVSIS